MTKKKARKGITPTLSKTPRISPTIKNPLDQNPVWHIGTIDLNGPWGWTEIEKEFFFNEILPKVQNLESMFWKNILGRNSHEVNVSQISSFAQKRLIKLGLEDTDTLISLRLTGRQRIWGIRIENILKILWWDPNHEVYPSKLKHT